MNTDLVANTSTVIAIIANEPEKPEKPKRSALDAAGIDLGISTKEIVEFVRERRERI